jgi:hypothetical protein
MGEWGLIEVVSTRLKDGRPVNIEILPALVDGRWLHQPAKFVSVLQEWHFCGRKLLRLGSRAYEAWPAFE